MIDPVETGLRAMHPMSIAVSNETSGVLKGLAVEFSTVKKVKPLSVPLLCTFGTKWYADALEIAGGPSGEPLVCMTDNFQAQTPSHADRVAVSVLLCERQRRLLEQRISHDEHTLADMIRISTYNFIGALQTQQCCAIDLVTRAQQVQDQYSLLHEPNIHGGCRA